jgi:hypothetical protein
VTSLLMFYQWSNFSFNGNWPGAAAMTTFMQLSFSSLVRVHRMFCAGKVHFVFFFQRMSGEFYLFKWYSECVHTCACTRACVHAQGHCFQHLL